MVDICCCYGEDTKLDGDKVSKTGENICPLRDQCYRYTVKPDKHYQSYFVETPYDKKKKSCKYFWTNEPEPEAA